MKNLALSLFLGLCLSACVTSPELERPKNADLLSGEGVSIIEESKSEILSSIEEKFLAWKAKEPSHYRYVVYRNCCEVFAPYYGPNEVEVKDGEIISVTYRGKSEDGFQTGDSLLGVGYALNYSIDDIFSFVSSRIQKSYPVNGQNFDTRYLMDYDVEYGFPAKAAHTIQDTIIDGRLVSLSHNQVAMLVYDFQVIE